MAALRVVSASRVAMDTSSLLIAFGPPLTFKAPALKLIISDEFNDSQTRGTQRQFSGKYLFGKRFEI